MDFQRIQEINYSDGDCLEMIMGGVVSARVFKQALGADKSHTIESLKKLYRSLSEDYSTINHFRETLKCVGVSLH